MTKITGDGGQPAPKITYPCPYSLKIVGDNTPEFADEMLDIVERYDPHLDRNQARFQDSRHNNFRSIRLVITATSERQLKELFQALKASGKVHMVI